MIKQISSDKKRILVFSDPHQDTNKVKHILSKENYDFVVCLGDWFDSHYYDNEDDLTQTCLQLKTLTFKDNFLTLFGNHDIHYFFINKYAMCSGFSHKKDEIISDIFNEKFAEIRGKFQWYVWIDDFLCSHAGVHINHFPALMTDLSKESINEWLENESEQAHIKLINGESHWFYRAGAARGGNQKIGGIVWMDFDYEFEPINGLKQIVGHTHSRKSQVRNSPTDGTLNLAESPNLCIDCDLNQYLIIENGKIEIKNYIDL